MLPESPASFFSLPPRPVPPRHWPRWTMVLLWGLALWLALPLAPLKAQESAQATAQAASRADSSHDNGANSHWLRSLTLTGHRGMILAPQPEVSHLAGIRTTGVQLSVSPRWWLSEEWFQAYGRMYTGLTLLVNANGPTSVLGTSVALGPYMNPRLWHHGRHSFLFWGATGLVWSSTAFDVDRNPQNPAVANTWSALLQGGLHYQLRLWPQLYTQLGLSLTHYSNGSYRMPNYGLNMPQVSLGVHYAPHEQAGTPASPLAPYKVDRRWSLWLQGQVGLAEHLPVDGPKFVTNTATAMGWYRLGRKSSLSVGLDYMVNPSLQRWFRYEPQWQGSHTDAAGITLGHVLHVGQVNLVMQAGFSFYKPFPLYPNLYQRIAFMWQPLDRFQAGMVLKMHGFSAETVEVAVAGRVW